MPYLENWPLPLQTLPPICYFRLNNCPEDAHFMVPLKLFSLSTANSTPLFYSNLQPTKFHGNESRRIATYPATLVLIRPIVWFHNVLDL